MSQELSILNHMKQHGSITALQALRRYDCLRLAARIYDLRCKGHHIESQQWKTNSGKVVARYWLKNKPPTVRKGA